MEEKVNPELEDQTVFVIDDYAPMRITLGNFLRAAQLRVETFDSAKSFIESFDPQRPGCLVLDLQMPEMSGLDLQEWLVSSCILLPVIIVSGEATVRDAVRAMKLGSFEFIEKPYQSDHLLQKIIAALEFDHTSRNERMRRDEWKKHYGRLSKREREILPLVISGNHSKAIADQLGITPSTVDNHRANIMKKLRAENSVDLARIALVVDPGLALK